VREAQGEGRRLEGAREVLLGEAVEGALAAGRAVAQRLEERERLHARLHAEREDLGERGLHGEARRVVRELGDRARADRADVEGLVADRAQQRLAAPVGRLVAAHPDGEPAALRARHAAAYGCIEEIDAERLQLRVHAAHASGRVGGQVEPGGAFLHRVAEPRREGLDLLRAGERREHHLGLGRGLGRGGRPAHAGDLHLAQVGTRHRVAGAREVRRHVGAHHAQSDECGFHAPRSS
jgi:hypothetical protein